MKKIILYSIALLGFTTLRAQEFEKDIATAKASYTGGKLEETHFALQQALSELDIIIGKEVLKLLPPKIDTAAFNPKDDRVTSNVGFAGATLHRSYGTGNKATVEIISNSPMIASLNAILNMPMMGGIMRDENNKTIRIQGYKARLERQAGSMDNQYNYVLQLPYSSALLTLTVNNCTEDDITKLANSLPLDKIAKLIQ